MPDQVNQTFFNTQVYIDKMLKKYYNDFLTRGLEQKQYRAKAKFLPLFHLLNTRTHLQPIFASILCNFVFTRCSHTNSRKPLIYASRFPRMSHN